MIPIPPITSLVKQSNIGLIYKSRGLQRVIPAFFAHVSRRYSSKLRFDNAHQFGAGTQVPIRNPLEQSSYLFGFSSILPMLLHLACFGLRSGDLKGDSDNSETLPNWKTQGTMSENDPL